MALTPLGDRDVFSWFSGKPQAWGPDGAGWRAWFAGNVVDGLCELLDEHMAVERVKGARWPAAIGCVPWLGSQEVADRLAQMWSCIVVDKNEVGIVPDQLINGRRRMPNTALRLGRHRPDDFPDDEEDLVLSGEEPRYEYGVGPVRVYGWRQQQPPVTKPLLHTKLLVLGEIQRWVIDPGDAPSFEETHFVPQQVWCGSANWSNTSRLHLELGLACSDEQLVYHATDFIRSLITDSEPVYTQAAGPEPSLVYIEEPGPTSDEIAQWEAYRAESRADDSDLNDDDH